MARVTMQESDRFVSQLKGVRMFRYDAGKMYHLLFLGETENPHSYVLYMNPIHVIRTHDGKFRTVRCADERKNSSNVIVKDGDKVINDGTCLYCEVRNEYEAEIREKRDIIAAEKGEKAAKAWAKNQYDKINISRSEQVRVFLVAVLETEKGKVKVDADGNKLFTIQALEMKEGRYENKFAELIRTLEEIDRDNGIENPDRVTWGEYYAKFPMKEKRSEVGKNMSFIKVDDTILSKDPEFKQVLLDEVKKYDLDAFEKQIFSFRLRSLEEMQRDVAPFTGMTFDIDEEAKEDLGEEAEISEDDLDSMVGEKKEPATDKEEKGSRVFDDADDLI